MRILLFIKENIQIIKGNMVFFVMMILLISCQNIKGGHLEENIKSQQATSHTKEIKFSLPDIPLTIIGNKGEQDYLAEHYWDKLDLKDTVLLNDKETLERIFVNYIYVVSTQKIEIANSYIIKFMQRFDKHKQWMKEIMRIADSFLFDINSPLYNEAMYVPFVEVAVHSTLFNEIEKERFVFQLNVASKNNPAQKATNFVFLDTKGSKRSLHDTVTKNTILMFSDPECQGCTEAANMLRQDIVINNLIKKEQLEIIMIYTEGDNNVWQQIKQTYPSSWTLGFDENETIKLCSLYSLRAMPSIYFLNQECIVFLKDKPINIIIDFIKDHVRRTDT